MGCICSGESDIEHFLTDFIDELKIRKYDDKKLFSYINRNSPFKSLRTSYDEFLRSNQNEEIHTNYQNILFAKEHHLFFASLVFLIHCDAKNMSANYKMMIEQIRTSHQMYKDEPLEQFTKDDYDILSDVLRFYTTMVSLDIIEAAAKSKKEGNNITEEQMKVLRNNYGPVVIDIFVRDLMKDCKNPNIDLDEFFKKNYMNLKHPIVRERLRKIFENKDSLFKNNNAKKEGELVSASRPVVSERNDGEKYKYTLPNIDYTGSQGISKENYGSNNYGAMTYDEEECVEGGNPGNFEDNNRLRQEMEKLKLEQYNIYRRECLYHHNKIREMHGVPPLRESDSLSEYSQHWANFIAETDTLTHSSMIWDGKNVGENIAKAGAIINDPSQLIVHKWYEEKENYDFANPNSQNNTKNFTQMVWKKTESIGFGLSYSQSGNTFIVINYYPAGNTPSEYSENVPRSQN